MAIQRIEESSSEYSIPNVDSRELGERELSRKAIHLRVIEMLIAVMIDVADKSEILGCTIGHRSQLEPSHLSNSIGDVEVGCGVRNGPGIP